MSGKRLSWLTAGLLAGVLAVPAYAALVAHYPFDGSANDAVGTAHGTIMGNPSYVAGQAGQAIGFDGVDDAVQIPRSVKDNFTITFWVKTTDPGTTDTGTRALWQYGHGMVSGIWGGAAHYDFGVGINDKKTHAGTGLPTNKGSINTTNDASGWVDTGQWIHVAVTRRYSDNEMAIYYNAVEKARGYPRGTSMVNQSLDSLTYLGVGAHWNQGTLAMNNFFVGLIDDLRFYDTVLTAAEIQATMSQEAADLVAPQIGQSQAAPVTLSWQAGPAVQSPATILNYYLYLDPNQLLFPMPDPNRGDAGGPRTLEDVQVSPPGGNTLGQVNYVWNGPTHDDTKYYWAVDSIIQRPMSPTDPNLVVVRAAGNVWWFQGPATLPGLTGPADVYVMPDLTKHKWTDDPNALFTVNITNFGKPVNKVEWYKVGTPDTLLTPGAKYEIASTNTVTKLTVHNVNRSTAMTDNGYYYVKVWLDINGSPAAQPGVSGQAYLRASVDTGAPGGTGLRHRYSFSEVAGTTVADSISAKNGTIKVKSPPEGGTYAWGSGQLTLDNESPAVGDNDSDPNGAYVDLPNGMISALRENCTFLIWYTWQDPNYNDSSSIYQRVWDFGSSSATGGEDQTGPAASTVFVRLATKSTQAANQIQFQSSKAGAAQDLNDGPTVWNQQVCVAVVLDGAANQWRMYVNGVQSPTTTVTPNQTLASLNDVNNWIGRCQQNNRGFYTGKLNEFRIYDMPLTAPWIKAAYDEGPDDIDLDPCLYPPTEDINGDCRVSLVDFKDFVAHWLHCGLLSCNP